MNKSSAKHEKLFLICSRVMQSFFLFVAHINKYEIYMLFISCLFTNII